MLLRHRFLVVFLANVLISSSIGALAAAAAHAAPSSLVAAKRVFVYDGRTETYLAIAPLAAPYDDILAVDPRDPASWNTTMSYVRHPMVTSAGASAVIGVGQLPPHVQSALLDIQNVGRATVLIEPEPWALVERVVRETGVPVTAVWASREDLPAAVHAASLRGEEAGLVLPTDDPERLRFMLGSGRVERVLAVGRAIPASSAGPRLAGIRSHALVVNVALDKEGGRPIGSSSQSSSGTGPEKMIDGNLGSSWTSASGFPANQDATLELAFGRTYRRTSSSST
jgi:hypothetical protein